MGRSVGDFTLPGWAPAAVLQAAVDYGAAQGGRVETAAPNFVVVSKGDATLWAKNVLLVAATDAPGGANVHVEVWFETSMLGEKHANPKTIVSMVPRRAAWKFASQFLARIGIGDPEPMFRHL